MRYDTRSANMLDEVPPRCPRCDSEWRPRKSDPEHRYCPECAKVNANRWKAANPEKAREIVRAASRRYKKRNRDEINQRQNARYRERRELT
jgi:TRAP-type C4-dicarboxylate transport system substrate-binding protein